MNNSALNALLTAKAKASKATKDKVIFVRVSNDVYSEIMTKRGRLLTEAGENVSISQFVLKAIAAFKAE
jgi:hypothetical protein